MRTRLTDLLAVFGDMANAAAAVAQILVLLALAGEVAVLVAFEALLAAAAKATASTSTAAVTIATIATSTAAAAASSCRTGLGTFPGKVAHSVALVTGAGTHFSRICEEEERNGGVRISGVLQPRCNGRYLGVSGDFHFFMIRLKCVEWAVEHFEVELYTRKQLFLSRV